MNAPNVLFVFQIGSILTPASASAVNVINGGTNTGVYWLVVSSARLATATTFAGNILASQSTTLNNWAIILCGRALAQNATVTMDANTVSTSCLDGGGYGSARVDFGRTGFSAGTQPVPEPGSMASEFSGV